MIYKSLLTYCLCVLYLFASGAVIAAKKSNLSRTKNPNIIFILADDLGYQEVGVYGQTKIKTPNIDQLAKEGIRFTQHYSGSPVCAPSRSTIMEGKHTGKSTVRGNFSFGGWHEELGQFPLQKGTRTIAHMFKEKGYVTAVIGKWGLGGIGSTGMPTKQGFDYFYGYLDQKYAHNYYPTHLWRNDEVVHLNNKYIEDHQILPRDKNPNDPKSYKPFIQSDYAPDLMLDEAVAFIKQHKDKSFFLYFPVTIPHVSLQVPDDALQEYQDAFAETPYTGWEEKTWLTYLPNRTPRATYAAMVTRMDRYVGQIVNQLKLQGIEDNTLIIFSSDNGPTFNGGSDSEFFNSTGNLRGLKGSVYEGGIRVPFIAKWPNKISKNQTSDHVSAQWDLMATFAELIGGTPSQGHTGVSFAPALLGDAKQKKHEYLYWELGKKQAVRIGDWKGIRRLNKDGSTKRLELYNLSTDLEEQHNLAANHADIVKKVLQVMDRREEALLERWNF